MQTNGKGRKKHRSLSFSLLEHRAFVLTRFVLPVDVLSLSQEKERNSLNIDKFLFLQTVIKYFAP